MVLGSRSVRNSTASLALLAIASIGALTFVYVQQRKAKRRSPIDDSCRPPTSTLHQWRSFQTAARRILQAKIRLANGDKLILYALYKQVTVGDAPDKFVQRPTISPDRLLREQAKYASWCDVREMDRVKALEYYVKAVDDFIETSDTVSTVSDFEDDDDDGFEAGAAAVSTPLVDTTLPSIDTSTIEGQMLSAASQSNVQELTTLLQDPSLDKDHADETGQTALHLAADRGAVECVQALLAAGCAVDAADQDGISVLQAAVIAGHVETVQALLRAGADPDRPDEDGDTPRSCAQDDPSMTAFFSGVE